MGMITELPFSRLSLLLGDDGVDALRGLRVIIFGVGGVGSWCAEALARSAVGAITIVDSDVVAPSNLNRQLVALNSTIGQPKVDIMARRIQDINPECRVAALNRRYTPETAGDFDLDSYDYIIDAIDSLGDKADLILRSTACEKARLFSSMGAALKSDVSRIAVTEFRDVKGCPLARALRQRFRRTGTFPRRKFKCVYSPELCKNHYETLPADIAMGSRLPNGTVVFATATFGLTLASLVVNDAVKRQSSQKPTV